MIEHFVVYKVEVVYEAIEGPFVGYFTHTLSPRHE